MTNKTTDPKDDEKDHPPTKPTLQRRRTTIPFPDPEDEAFVENLSGIFRGIAAATRKAAIVAKKVVIAKGPATAKQVVRAVGDNRPLAFASEGAVAGDAIIPRWVFYGAWGLSGVAIAADIYNKYDDAPTPLKNNTAIYWTAFHIPASLIIPAAIIHQVVHYTEKIVENPQGMARNLPPRAKALAPVAAAMLSIIPVVPTVDHLAEAIMEPSLGSYLGLEFHHHHGHPPADGAAPKAKEA